MAITTRGAWTRDGSPWRLAAPISDFATTLRRYGYLIGTLGDDRHLNAVPPEDHTPYSQTGWPGLSPYPVVMAIDIEQALASAPGITVLSAQIVADKLANRPGTQWIKYINWTDVRGDCWEDSWTPNHVRTRSTDRGHTHLSCRTDYATSRVAQDYDPIATLIGDVVTPKDFLAILKDPAVAFELSALPHRYRGSNPVPAGAVQEWTLINDIHRAVLASTPPVDGAVPLDQIREVIREELAKLKLGLDS